MNRFVETGMPTQHMRGITLRLNPNVCAMSKDGAFGVALRTLTSALALLAPGHACAWTVADGESSPPRAFVVTPCPGERVSVLDTWNLIHLLREQPDVLTVEPAFVVNQNHLTHCA